MNTEAQKHRTTEIEKRRTAEIQKPRNTEIQTYIKNECQSIIAQSGWGLPLIAREDTNESRPITGSAASQPSRQRREETQQ